MRLRTCRLTILAIASLMRCRSSHLGLWFVVVAVAWATIAVELWRTSIPGLAHSSPIVWGDLFGTSAVSSRASATFKTGNTGEGTPSEDLSSHRSPFARGERWRRARRTRRSSRGSRFWSKRSTVSKRYTRASAPSSCRLCKLRTDMSTGFSSLRDDIRAVDERVSAVEVSLRAEIRASDEGLRAEIRVLAALPAFWFDDSHRSSCEF